MSKPHQSKAEYEAEIIRIAAEREFVVHRYGVAHTLFRKTSKRMLAEGRLVLVAQNARSFYYRTPEAVQLEREIEAFTLTPDPKASEIL